MDASSEHTIELMPSRRSHFERHHALRRRLFCLRHVTRRLRHCQTPRRRSRAMPRARFISLRDSRGSMARRCQRYCFQELSYFADAPPPR